MIKFILENPKKFQYELYVNDRMMHNKRFNTENDAIAWYKNYVSSWNNATLIINFKREVN